MGGGACGRPGSAVTRRSLSACSNALPGVLSWCIHAQPPGTGASVQACPRCLPWAEGSPQPLTHAGRSATCRALRGHVARACPRAAHAAPGGVRSMPVAPVCGCCAQRHEMRERIQRAPGQHERINASCSCEETRDPCKARHVLDRGPSERKQGRRRWRCESTSLLSHRAFSSL